MQNAATEHGPAGSVLQLAMAAIENTALSMLGTFDRCNSKQLAGYHTHQMHTYLECMAGMQCGPSPAMSAAG